jgi:hypothetical protein
LQDDTVSQLLGVTIVVISVTRDLVPIDLVKGNLRMVVNILMIAQHQEINTLLNYALMMAEHVLTMDQEQISQKSLRTVSLK